jgi:hypothetical protein
MTLVALWWVRAGTVSAKPAPYPEDCNDVCSETGSCTDTCYATDMDFINDIRTSCLTWGVYALPCCDDGLCSQGEDASSCFDDCHCGDLTCNAGEGAGSCPVDCGENPVVDIDCEALADACSDKCGETVFMDLLYTVYQVDYHWAWGALWPISHTVHVFTFWYGEGVDSFECDEGAWASHCTCRY